MVKFASALTAPSRVLQERDVDGCRREMDVADSAATDEDILDRGLDYRR